MTSSRLTDLLGIRYPILQAPIGSIAGVELAAATSNAGGMGSLALTWTPPDTRGKVVTDLAARTQYPFFVNFVLAFPLPSIGEVLDAGVPVISFSWGQPGTHIDTAHKTGAKVAVQVGTREGAIMARDAGADFIICQGVEAGGHVQSSTPLMTLLQAVAAACPELPLVAAGGLADGKDIARVMEAGADGVMLGTRFVATAESRAHAEYKQALVSARAEDTAMTTCFNGGWNNAPHRVLRNKTLKAWEAAGCPPDGRRPGEGEVIARRRSGQAVLRYDESSPASDLEGDIEAFPHYAGIGCGKISNIPTVQDLMAKLWAGYERATSERISQLSQPDV